MIIFESLSSAKKKYLETGKISQEDFAGLLFVDKTPSKKHIEWICKMYLEDKNFDEIILGELLEEFEKKNKFIEQKDINKYQSIKDLQDAIIKAQETKIEKMVGKLTTQPEIVFQNEKVIVFRPKTKEEAIDLGRGTKWCISTTESKNYWEDYYYKKLFTIYIIFNFTGKYNKYKIAVLVDRFGDLHSIWDANDEENTIDMLYIESLGVYESIFVAREMNVYDSLLRYGIKNYTINNDGSIDVDGNVKLSRINLTNLPFKFGKISGNFYCSNNLLTSLEGAPTSVGGEFYC